jgi:hypothetical protein
MNDVMLPKPAENQEKPKNKTAYRGSTRINVDWEREDEDCATKSG